ncbi:MAG: RteC domain-containing protein [Flavobacteriaceae bacterium]|nr:RteC domain-containing protein [Flavobacteriaceae bacterium]
MTYLFYEQTLEKLKCDLYELKMKTGDAIENSEKAVEICLDAINNVKKYFKANPINNQEDEIKFFKKIKPQFLSKLIFHIKIYNMESLLPHECKESREEAYRIESKKIKKYANQNQNFYRYFRTNSTHLDNKYFVRGNQDLKLKLKSNTFESDPEFSTSHDFILSKIIANTMFQKYLKDKLIVLNTNHSPQLILSKPIINWTSSKVALIELIYALHTTNSFNHGKSDIKEIAKLIEQTFNIDLGDYYRAFLEIRMRKTGRTKYLDTLKEQLIKRMNQADEN